MTSNVTLLLLNATSKLKRIFLVVELHRMFVLIGARGCWSALLLQAETAQSSCTEAGLCFAEDGYERSASFRKLEEIFF